METSREIIQLFTHVLESRRKNLSNNESITFAYFCTYHSLQMKGRWKSNINVWFPFMYSQKWNCVFQNRIIMLCLPVPTLIYPGEIYIFPGSVCLFCCREPILEIYKSLTDTCVEIGSQAAQFSEKEYINEIFLAVLKTSATLKQVCRNLTFAYCSTCHLWCDITSTDIWTIS